MEDLLKCQLSHLVKYRKSKTVILQILIRYWQLYGYTARFRKNTALLI